MSQEQEQGTEEQGGGDVRDVSYACASCEKEIRAHELPGGFFRLEPPALARVNDRDEDGYEVVCSDACALDVHKLEEEADLAVLT